MDSTFSDGILAVIITMVGMQLHVPEGHDFSARGLSAKGFFAYLLSLLCVDIYLNNLHHLFQLTEPIAGSVVWTNVHPFFWPRSSRHHRIDRRGAVAAHRAYRLRLGPRRRWVAYWLFETIVVDSKVRPSALARGYSPGCEGQDVAGALPRRPCMRSPCSEPDNGSSYLAIVIGAVR